MERWWEAGGEGEGGSDGEGGDQLVRLILLSSVLFLLPVRLCLMQHFAACPCHEGKPFLKIFLMQYNAPHIHNTHIYPTLCRKHAQ